MRNKRERISLSPDEEAEVANVERTTACRVEARRCRMVRLLHQGYRVADIALWLGCSRGVIYSAWDRWNARGRQGLQDDRRHRSPGKATRPVRQRLLEYLDTRPREYGWARATWTLELLSRQLAQDTGVGLCASYLGRVLRQEKCRRGRPRPVVKKNAPGKAQAIARLELVVARAAPSCEVFYLDEAEVHLNPKPGFMWMKRGQQIEVETPGQNVKYHLAGALNARTGTLTYVHGPCKNSALFVALLEAVCHRYRRSALVHLILDNYGIHKSGVVQAAVGRLGGRAVLHFLPPYSPEHNRIEPLWKQMHDEVTRNHTRTSMPALWQDVVHFLHCVQPFPGTQASTRRLVA